jgi:hypothetical protein
MQKIIQIFGIGTCLILFIFAITANFSGIGYTPVRDRFALQFDYYQEGKNKDNLTQVAYDFFSLPEYENNNEFYWLQSTGDTLTITNLESERVNGSLTFILSSDPCNTKRTILIGDISSVKKIDIGGNEPETEVKINFELEGFNSSFHSINTSSSDVCKLKNGDTRNLVAKIKNVNIKNK